MRISDPGEGWFYSLWDFESDIDEYRFQNGVVLRRLPERPTAEHLLTASATKREATLAAPFVHDVTFEVFVPSELADFDDSTQVIANLTSLMMVHLPVDLAVLAAADCSWSDLASSNPDTRETVHVDFGVSGYRASPQPVVGLDDLVWTESHLERFISLRENPRFEVAIWALVTHNLESHGRMHIASLWTGIEGLVGVENELSFRLSAFLASYLVPRGPERLEAYRRIRKLYAARSRAVHGSQLADESLTDEVLATRLLLSDLLARIIEAGCIPSPSEWEAILLT